MRRRVKKHTASETMKSVAIMSINDKISEIMFTKILTGHHINSAEEES